MGAEADQLPEGVDEHVETQPSDQKSSDSDTSGAIRHAILVVYQAGGPRVLDSAITQALADKVIVQLEEICGEGVDVLDVWLESAGGSADAAYRIASVCRSLTKSLRVVIPFYAKSAATLMSLAADIIYMGLGAELGPLDVQLQHSQDEFRPVSALDAVHGLEYLSQLAVYTSIIQGQDVWKATHVPRSECVRNMLHFMAEFMQPLVDKLDPILLHEAYRQLKVAQEYGVRLLCEHGPDGKYSREDAQRLTIKLAEKYPTHSFVIDAAEGTKIGLPVADGKTYEYWAQAKELYQQCIEAETNVVRVFEAEDLKQVIFTEEEDEDLCQPVEDLELSSENS